MSASQNGVNSQSHNSASELDRRGLWGDFQAQAVNRAQWRDKLARRLAHKSLNIPLDDEMNVVTSNRTGVTWKEITAAGLIVAILLVLFFSVTGLYPRPSQPAAPANEEQQQSDVKPPQPGDSLERSYMLDISGS